MQALRGRPHRASSCMAGRRLFALGWPSSACRSGLEADRLLAHGRRSGRDRRPRARRRRSTQRSRVREIEAALAANDADLAKSFLDLARERGVARAAGAGEAASPPRSSAPIAAAGARRKLRARADHRRAGRRGRPCRHRARRPVRVRRHPRRGARGQPLRQRRAGRRADARARLRRHRDHRRAPTRRFGAAAPARIGLSAVKAARKTGRIGARHGAIGSAARCAR